MGKLLKKIDVTTERWLEEVAKIGFFDVKDAIKFANEHGINLQNWDDIDGASIQAIKETRDKEGNVLIDVKFHDKLKALELMGRYLKLFTQDLELKLPTPMILQDENGKTMFELGFDDSGKEDS